jgi:transcriptional regulator with XRE-family HTH domain
MPETQKNIISQLLKEKGKSKRELAAFLDIHENGINRLIGNRKISMERLEQIAQFLEMNMKVLFDKVYPKSESELLLQEAKLGNLRVEDKTYDDVEEIILLLSEVIKGQKKITDLEEQNSENLSILMNLMIKASANK